MFQVFLSQGGGGGGGNYVQLIVLLIVMGFSGLSWLFRKIQEQAAKKRAMDQLERRKLEALRTGRDVGAEASGDVDAQAREQAARRRAQIEELRRRQQERSRAKVNVPAAERTPPMRPLPPILRVPGSSGPTVPQRGPGRTTSIKPVPVPKPQRATQEKRRPQPPKPARRPLEQRPVESRRITAPLEQQQLTAAPPEPAPAREVLAVTGVSRPRSAAEWRRAIVLSELLSPPKALRGPGDEESGLPGWPAGGVPR